MAVRSPTVVLVVVCLLLTACVPVSLPAPSESQTALPPATVGAATTVSAPTPTHPPAASALASAVVPALSPPEPAATPPPPPPTAAPTAAPPEAPTPGRDAGTAFRAWGIAPDGRFCLLQSSGTVRRHSPDMATVIDESGPLFAGQDPGRAHMAIGEDFLVLSSETLTRTLVLERESFAPVWQLDRAGPIALDGSRRLFVLSGDAVWAYDLANAAAPPVAVTKWPVDAFTPRPRNLAVDDAGNQLLVTLHDVSASPPHQQEWFAAYDLDTLQPLRSFGGQLGELTRPSIGGDRVVAGMAAKNGFLGSTVAVFDRQGQEVRAAKPFDGKPVVDATGEWIYVLREREIWVLKASDLSLDAVKPFVDNSYIDLLLSPDGAKLYLLGDGVIATEDTAQLRAEGIAPLRGPLMGNWFDPAQTDFFRARFFQAPSAPDTAFVQVGGYGETWRSNDRGKTWELLPGLVYPNFHYATHLSISPDFATDRTLVAVLYGEPGYLRSTDAGDTWAMWKPPVAFVSDRDGNREIYTAGRGTLGGGQAQNLGRLTNDPAAEENPAWSPGWTRIAFQSNRNGNWDIFTIRADCDPKAADAATACDLRQLTNDPADDMLPAWSPDGRWIAFVSTRSGTADIYLAPSGGGAAIPLLLAGTAGAWRPAWLADSQRFLFTAPDEDGSNDLWGTRVTEEPDGTVGSGGVNPVVDSPWDERNAAVGRELFVYLSNQTGYPTTFGRYTYDAATSYPFTTGMEAEGHPALLDDGLNTVLVTLEREGRTGIYRANTSGYEPFVVDGAFNGQPAAGPVPWQPPADWSEKAASDWMK